MRRLASFAFVLAAAVLSQAQTATVTTLYNFTGGPGTDPYGALIQASDGNFYGNGLGGGGGSNCENGFGCPIVYKITPAGTLSTVATINENGAQVSIEGTDGNFYGIGSGTYNTSCPGLYCGEILEITPGGIVTTIYSFTGVSNGQGPNPALIQGSDGNFYGTTRYGGDGNINYGQGTIFQLTPAGVLTTLHSFCSDVVQGRCVDGSEPVSGLVQGTDGAFYGTTPAGGGGGGVAYRITSDGTYTVLCTFGTGAGCSAGGADVVDSPVGSLVQGGDGNFMGNTEDYYFQLDPSTSTLYPSGLHQSGQVVGSIFEGGDQNYYGVASNPSTIFQVVAPTACSACTVHTLYSFPSAKKVALNSGLVQGADGSFYGVTELTSATNLGSIYKATLSTAPGGPVQLSLSSQAVNANNPVTLTWKVMNASSMTLQQCYASIQNNATGAGTWTGRQVGSMVGGAYSGSSEITPTANGTYTYALTCGGTESGFASLSVGGVKANSITILTSNSPVTLGTVLTLTANVSTPQSIGALTGTVKFAYGSLVLGTVNVVNGVASLNITAGGIPPGTYTVTATYSGNADYNGSTTTTQVVVLGYPTSTTFSATPATLVQGQPATLTATVVRTGASGTPTGTVTFYVGTYALGSATLTGGTATLTEATNGTIAPGTYNIYATYNGDSADQGSSSSASSVTMLAATTTTITATPNPVPANQSVTFTVRVKETYGHAVPTGTVSVMLGSHAAGSAMLSGGSVTINFSTVGISAATYSAVAAYSGDATDGASSGTVSVQVE